MTATIVIAAIIGYFTAGVFTARSLVRSFDTDDIDGVTEALIGFAASLTIFVWPVVVAAVAVGNLVLPRPKHGASR